MPPTTLNSEEPVYSPIVFLIEEFFGPFWVDSHFLSF